MAPKAKVVAKRSRSKSVKKVAEKKAKTEKKAKVEEPKAEEPKKEEPKKEEEVKEEPKEQETDAPADKRPQIKEGPAFEPADCTLNVLPAMQGKVLMSLSDGGMQFLIAGARANVGIKAGRYFYEAKVIEALNPAEAAGNRGRVPLPRQLVRIGFSTAGSQLILGESEDGCCFDAEGTFTADMKKKTVAQRFGKNQTMGVLLNLDPKSPNADTVSLFHNGERYCEPQPLPESLKGKTLYPHVSYRNVTMHVNFGPEPMNPLPFKCRTVQSAAAADVVVAKSLLPKDGKYEVMFPVAFPDEGTFDWLDTFLVKNPQFVELSDRKIIDWASKSGLFKPKSNNSTKNSNDKPEFNYGLTAMDDFSVRRVLQAVAPFVPRNYLVMEVKENLTADDRIATLKKFSAPMYKKVAAVVMGEPNEEYKQVVHARILKEKKEKAKAEWEAKKKEKERKKQLALRQKQLADMRKKAEEQRKKAEAEKKQKAEEAKQKREEEAAKKKAEAEAKKKEQEAKKKEEEEEKKKAEAKEEGEEVAEDKKEEAEAEAGKEEEEKEKATAEETQEEETKEEPKEEAKEEAKEEQEEEVKEEPKEEEAQKEEEKEEEKEAETKEEEDEMDEDPPEVELTDEDKKVWFRPPTVTDLTSAVMSSAFGKFTLPEKSEGFDEIRYEWQPAAKANAYIRNWVLDKKVISKMEDLKPSDWFKGKHGAFTKAVKEWQTKQKPFEAKKKAEAKAAAKKATEKKKAGEEEEDEEVEEAAADELDIFAVEDIMDTGKGEPLFVGFTFEDWALLTLRYELFLLVNAFMHDADDEERKGVHETNLVYYYNKYYHKTLTPKHYGKETNQDLIDMVKDSVSIDKDSKVLKTNLESEVDALDIFVKLTEECRLERQRRTDAGDETARLKFNPLLNQVSKPPPVAAAVGVKATTTPGALRPAPGAVRPALGAVRPAGSLPAWAAARPAGPGAWRPGAFAGYQAPMW